MTQDSGGRPLAQTLLNQHHRAPVEAMPSDDGAPEGEGRQRIDRWLWHARLARTRSAAAALASAGHVRVNGARVRAPGRMVRNGDVITVALERAVRVLKV